MNAQFVSWFKTTRTYLVNSSKVFGNLKSDEKIRYRLNMEKSARKQLREDIRAKKSHVFLAYIWAI